MKNKYYIIGLMSGTSVDGLDVAYIELDIPNINEPLNISTKLLNFDIFDFPQELKEKIFRSFNHAIDSRFLCSLNFELAEFYAQSINSFIKKYNLDSKKIDFIASHGQTIYHLIDPNYQEVKSTLQIGDISVLAQLTNINVIGNFRTADVAVGGQGAPLVPKTDWLLFHKPNTMRLMQNIGGMGNVTVVTERFNDTFAYDTGPGNVLIDLAMQKFYNKPYDQNAEVAFSGKINQELFEFILRNDKYLDIKPPKSTGREYYSIEFLNNLITHFPNIKKQDFITALTYYTAYSIYDSYHKFVLKPDLPTEIYVSGGGANNSFIVQSLEQLFKKDNIPVYKSDVLGIDKDAKEAIAFGILGYLTWNHLPSNVPSATGAKKEVILGQIAFVK
ncbi:anhydro-N-acetylmuramic acid kinase [Mycoplasma hafezii]|uniref:anhydro-N-acetylmuramic acid kinase n=1 Tax=Mycoplasma hafezii TaxID=525886 RepID=UPI003CEBBA6F